MFCVCERMTQKAHELWFTTSQFRNTFQLDQVHLALEDEQKLPI
jgi:hypothetical protein